MNNSQSETPNKYRLPSLIIVCVFEIIILFMYGFFTSYGSRSPFVTSLQYIFTNVLAVLGFGLLLIYFRTGIMQIFVISIVICAISIQLGPLLQQFWFNVFVSGFPEVTPSMFSKILVFDSTGKFIQHISLIFVRISSYCSISLLVALTGVIGKIGLLNTIITTIIFNVGFHLSYYLNYMIYYKNSVDIMDDFQGSRVFMFGAGFGIALMLLYNRLSTIEKSEIADFTDMFATLLSLLGTCFILAFFYFVLDSYSNALLKTIRIIGGYYFSDGKLFGLLNIYFAFSGSIVSSIAVACFLGGTVTFHHINMSIISGALQVSILGNYIHHPFVALVTGVVGGVVSSILSHFAHQKLNQKRIYDTKGIIVIYFINCFLCSYVVTPIIIAGYDKTNNAGFHMIYTSISLGIGFGFGIIAGFVRLFIKEDISASDSNFFNLVYLDPLNPKQRPQKSNFPIIQEQPSVQMLSMSKTRRERLRDVPEPAIFIQV